MAGVRSVDEIYTKLRHYLEGVRVSATVTFNDYADREEILWQEMKDA